MSALRYSVKCVCVWRTELRVSSLLSWNAEAMLFWTALIQLCCCRSESACNKQLLHKHTHTHTHPVIWSMGYVQTCLNVFIGLITVKLQHESKHYKNQKNVACSKIQIHMTGQFWQFSAHTHTNIDSLGGRDNLKAESSVLFTAGLHCA